MKKCVKCGKQKTLDEFYYNKGKPCGKCKECIKEIARNNPKCTYKNKDSYDKTEKGVIRVIYKTQKANSKRRGHNPPTYSKEELKVFLYKNGFKELYENWVKSGYSKKQKPSIDRIDDYRGYSIDNISLTTWGQNHANQAKDIVLGRSKGGERCKPLLQIVDGQVVAEYVSFSSARRVMGYSMEGAIRTGRKDKKGYQWIYKQEISDGDVDVQSNK